MMPSIKSKAKPKPNQPSHDWQFDAIGTKWWLGIYQPLASQKLHALQRQVAARIEVFDKTYSRFRPDSLVAQIATKAGRYTFPDDASPLFSFYRQLYEATNGAVTPLIGSVLSDAGYDATYSLQPGKLASPPAWDEVLHMQGTELTVSKPVLLDFGAAGKGYLVDIVADTIRAAGVQHFCIDAGGDMTVQGDPSLQIGLEHPDDPTQAIGVATLHNQALCGSAGNRRAWDGYHHIMNPFTLSSTEDIKAVWVSAANVMLADGLATALFFAPPHELRQWEGKYQYVMVHANNQLVHSADFPATVFTKEQAHA